MLKIENKNNSKLGKESTMNSFSDLVWLKPPQPTAYKFRSIRQRCLVEVIVISHNSDSTINFSDRLIVSRANFSYFELHKIVNVVLIAFLNCWNVRVFLFKPGPVMSFLNSFGLFGVFLVLFPDFCYFPVNLWVNLVLLILYRVKWLIVRSDSTPDLVTLVVAINLASLTILISQLHVHIHRRQSFHSEARVWSVLLLVSVRWKMSCYPRLLITQLPTIVLHYASVKFWVFHVFALKWLVWVVFGIARVVFWVTQVPLSHLFRRGSHFLWRCINALITSSFNPFWRWVWRSHLK